MYSAIEEAITDFLKDDTGGNLVLVDNLDK